MDFLSCKSVWYLDMLFLFIDTCRNPISKYTCLYIQAKEKCSEIIAMARAEWMDVSERPDALCPVLDALKSVNPKKAVTGIAIKAFMYIYI